MITSPGERRQFRLVTGSLESKEYPQQVPDGDRTPDSARQPAESKDEPAAQTNVGPDAAKQLASPDVQEIFFQLVGNLIVGVRPGDR